MAKEKVQSLYQSLPKLYPWFIGAICLYLGIRIRLWCNLAFHGESVLAVALLMFLMFRLITGHSKENLVARNRVRTWLVGLSTFFFIYLSMSVVVVDLFQLVYRQFVTDPVYRDLMLLKCGRICLVFVVGAGLLASWQKSRIRVVKTQIRRPGFGKEYHMVLLSDLHIGYYVGVKHIARMVEQVNALHPDIVVIAGDLVNAGNTRECPEIDEVAKLLAQMRSREGTFAILGNHDPEMGDEDFQKFLRDAQITLLVDDIYTCSSCHLVGRNTRTRPRQTLGFLLGGVKHRRPVVVLDHDPFGVEEAVEQKADLILCGHTHKGQVFPLNLFCRAVYSRQQFWGRSVVGETDVVVSAGTGYFSMPMRLGSSCEIWDLTLTGTE